MLNLKGKKLWQRWITTLAFRRGLGSVHNAAINTPVYSGIEYKYYRLFCMAFPDTHTTRSGRKFPPPPLQKCTSFQFIIISTCYLKIFCIWKQSLFHCSHRDKQLLQHRPAVVIMLMICSLGNFGVNKCVWCVNLKPGVISFPCWSETCACVRDCWSRLRTLGHKLAVSLCEGTVWQH